MIIAIRKEPSGLLYIDKEIYSRTETKKLTLEEYERFKAENPSVEYLYGESRELVEKEKIIFNEETQSEEKIIVTELVYYFYITRKVFTEETLSLPPYNYTKVEIDDMYLDCQASDFNEDLTFSPIKYIDRKQREKDSLRISEIKSRLEQLSQDLIQAQAGAEFDDLEERKQEFQTLHNELRILLGKLPRQYN